MKKYSLCHFGGNRFALTNETDRDVYTDYFPGIWGIETQKRAVQYTKELLADGHKVVLGMGDQAKLTKIIQRATA